MSLTLVSLTHPLTRMILFLEPTSHCLLLTASASADPTRRAVHRRQNSVRKALRPSLLPERSSATGTLPGFARPRRPDCPTKRAAAAPRDREMKEMLRLA